MRQLAAAALAVSYVFSVNVSAATSQQRMAACNKEAGDRKGDDKKEFMKNCLKAKKEAGGAKMSQQDRMRACNNQAAGKKGAERRQFMSACLSGRSST